MRTARDFVVLASACPSAPAAGWPVSTVLPRPRFEKTVATGAGLLAGGYGELPASGVFAAPGTGRRIVPAVPGKAAATALKRDESTTTQDQQHLMNRRDHRTWRPPA